MYKDTRRFKVYAAKMYTQETRYQVYDTVDGRLVSHHCDVRDAKDVARDYNRRTKLPST